MRFEVLSHTADKGIKAYGADLKEVFENAAYGMFSLMAELERYSPTECSEIESEASDLAELLRGWLAELLFRFEVDRMLYTSFEVREISECRVLGVACGLPFSPEIEWLGSGVKAVTHHDLSVLQVAGRWEATVIVDV